MNDDNGIEAGPPDTRSPEFLAKAREDSRRVANSPCAREDQEFVDSLADADWDDDVATIDEFIESHRIELWAEIDRQEEEEADRG